MANVVKSDEQNELYVYRFGGLWSCDHQVDRDLNKLQIWPKITLMQGKRLLRKNMIPFTLIIRQHTKHSPSLSLSWRQLHLTRSDH